MAPNTSDIDPLDSVNVNDIPPDQFTQVPGQSLVDEGRMPQAGDPGYDSGVAQPDALGNAVIDTAAGALAGPVVSAMAGDAGAVAGGEEGALKLWKPGSPRPASEFEGQGGTGNFWDNVGKYGENSDVKKPMVDDALLPPKTGNFWDNVGKYGENSDVKKQLVNDPLLPPKMGTYGQDQLNEAMKVAKSVFEDPESTIAQKAAAQQRVSSLQRNLQRLYKQKYPDKMAGGGNVGTPSVADPLDSVNVNDIPPDQIQTQQEFYSAPGQEVKAGLEGVAQGAIGPFAPAIERGLGVKSEDIRGRAGANPWIHGGSEALGLVGSQLTGVGEAGLVAKAGEAAQGLTEAGEAANAIDSGAQALKEGKAAFEASLANPAADSIAAGQTAADAANDFNTAKQAYYNTTIGQKIAATGIKASAEMAALQTSDELSKAVTQDPNQTLQTAAVNIGLSGILGGAGGAVLGSIGPLRDKFVNKIGLDDAISDYQAQSQFLSDNPDLHGTIKGEIQMRADEVDAMRNIFNPSKANVLNEAVPESNPENDAKINKQIQGISDLISDRLDSASESVKTKSAVPYLNEDFTKWQSAVTDPAATNVDKFLATNTLKQDLESYAKWSLTEEGTAKGQLGRAISNEIRPLLEDTKVWGAAGDVQKTVNEATHEAIQATKDFTSKITTERMGKPVVDDGKLQGLLNQAEKGRGNKIDPVKQWLESTQKQADAIKKVHIDNGLEAPIETQFNKTPALNRVLSTRPSPGTNLANWVHNKGSLALANAMGKTVGGAVGGGLGFLVGHPGWGAIAGEQVLGPVVGGLAKPFAERALNSGAAQSSIEYLGNFIKGSKQLARSTSDLLKPGVEVLSKDLIPNQESRDRLKKSLEYVQNPTNITKVGGSIGHYLPNHASAAAYTAAVATQYLNSLKPTQPVMNGFDTPAPIDKAQQAKYNRALDIAQQPLMVLKFAKEGTLLPQDVQTLNTIYPNLHSRMVQLVSNELIKAKTDKISIPYAQRVSMSLLLGAPLDSTMTPQSMQSIMQSSVTQQAQQQNAPGKTKRASGTELKQIDKTNSLYPTALQGRLMGRRQ